uniref:Microsomal glutathione S-transferase 2 n=1 Tax=Sinocyclocheilus grahami TaxID=75366 RepID=A0A672TEZ0_SINGR
MTSDLPVLLAAVSILSAVHLGKQIVLKNLRLKIIKVVLTCSKFLHLLHQNSVESYSIFLVVLWISGIFFNEVLAAFGGLLYIVGREMYFTGYIRESKKRLPGFYLVLCALLFLTVMATVGIIQSFLDKYLNIRLL